MREETPSIVPLIKEQFPAFYQQDGEAFIAFVEAYYEWMAQENNLGDLQRGIYNLRDIDRTIDDFVIYFRTKYLANFGYLAEVDVRKLIKHSHELFATKGTEQGFKLLFQLLFNQEINVYYPGNDILRASDGKWFQPRYLEISPSSKNATYLYQEITGTTSGAKAFVEGIVRRTIGARIFDVFYLSNIRGAFDAGERITSDGIVDGSPVVLGSLVEIDITNGGAGYAIGDILDITNASGVNGSARVTAIENATGKVNFTLVDGGTGYRLASEVLISDKSMKINAVSNTNFELFEDVTMDIQTVGYASSNGGALANLATIVGTEAIGNTVVANGVILASNSTYVIINLRSGDFLTADDLYVVGTHHSLIANVANTDATGSYLGYTNTNSNLGLDDVSGTFYVGGQLSFGTSNATAIVETIYTGANAGFGIGSLTNTDQVEIWTDILDDLNEEGVPFIDIILDGSNANTAANTYGFPRPVTGYTATLDTLLEDALDRDDFDVGTIASINQVRPGSNYNADPAIVVYDRLTAGFDRRNLIFNIANTAGVLLAGEEIIQEIQVPGYDLTVSSGSGFQPHEGVVQAVSGAEGQVVSGNSTHLIISSYNEVPFVVGQEITGQQSAATANVTANTYLASEVSATAIVTFANTTTVYVKPTSLSTLFDTRFSIEGQTSLATANIVSIETNNDTLPMGLNADVDGRVVTANGVISAAVPVNSGFGYTNGEELTLGSDDNLTVATGTAGLDSYGTGEGYFKNSDGFLSADKYLQDNNYYQAYAYEIQTGISLSRYADVLKRSFHIAGTRLFGKVVRVDKIRECNVDIEALVTTG